MSRSVGLGQRLTSAAARFSHPLVVGRTTAGHFSVGCGRWLRFQSPLTPLSGTAALQQNPLARLEAVFFLSQQPQTSRKLAQLADLADGTKARTLVRTLNRRYDAVGSAFRVEEVAGGFQLMTRPKFAPWLRRMHATSMEVRLSAPAMESLAVVAYRQPVLRADVEAIRGVQSGEVLRQLIERDLVRIVGRSDELGRPFLYGTTKQFLQAFGLRHLDELPRAELLRGQIHSPPNHADSPIPSHTGIIESPHQFPIAEEETNVSTFVTSRPRRKKLDTEQFPATACPSRDDRPGLENAFGSIEEEIDLHEEEEDEDFEDDFDDDEEEDEDDLEDESWEEVEDDDEDLDDDDEDWDEDEDWDDDDEDWDDEDDDWDDDDDEEEEEEEEEE